MYIMWPQICPTPEPGLLTSAPEIFKPQVKTISSRPAEDGIGQGRVEQSRVKSENKESEHTACSKVYKDLVLPCLALVSYLGSDWAACASPGLVLSSSEDGLKQPWALGLSLHLQWAEEKLLWMLWLLQKMLEQVSDTADLPSHQRQEYLLSHLKF